MFVFKQAVTTAEMESVFRLRYQVYVLERGFESPEEHPGGLERDDYDDVAWHYLALDDDSRPIGTVRLIRASGSPFPIERHCTIESPVNPERRPGVGEISRLAVSRDYRRRAGDTVFGLTDPGGEAGASGSARPDADRRGLPVIFMGLLRELYRTSLEESITHWYAVMERQLSLLLRRYAFNFRPVGPYCDYRGCRAPFLADIADMERRVAKRHPEIYRYFREGMRPVLPIERGCERSQSRRQAPRAG